MNKEPGILAALTTPPSLHCVVKSTGTLQRCCDKLVLSYSSFCSPFKSNFQHALFCCYGLHILLKCIGMLYQFILFEDIHRCLSFLMWLYVQYSISIIKTIHHRRLNTVGRNFSVIFFLLKHPEIWSYSEHFFLRFS